MFKKLLQGVVLGGALLGLAVAASAANVNLNLYGASAQYLFWNDAADNFLTSRGCTGVAQDEYNSKHGITKGTCGSDTVYIRYSSKASFDGIGSVKGTYGDPDGCGSPFQRKMVNEATCTDWVLGGTACTGLKCVEVTLGAADVAGESFQQSSHGQLKGPNAGGWTDRAFTGMDTTGLDPYQPVVVPFAFFANNSVTQTRCVAPTPAASKAVSAWGYQCVPDQNGNSADCIGYYECASGTCSGGVNSGNACTRANQCPDVAVGSTSCVSIPLDNISRLMAVMIFSGQAWNWTDFGAWYPADMPIVACLRHAGSGTHATLDWSVMRSTANDWGWPLVQNESASAPTVWFNDGSPDEMACINQLNGAIGYADADQLEGTDNFPNVHALKYQGVEPRRTKVRNGEYDFFSNQWLYGNPDRSAYSSIKTTWISNGTNGLIDFASDPANIPSSKAKFWATKGEMNYNKGNDTLFPGYVGASNPQQP